MTKEEEFLVKIDNPLFIDKLEVIAEYYGAENQCRMLAEECAELTKEVLKAIRCGYANKDAIAEEIADVSIMLYQIQCLLDIDLETVAEIENAKIKRQIERIKAEIGAKNEAERKS